MASPLHSVQPQETRVYPPSRPGVSPPDSLFRLPYSRIGAPLCPCSHLPRHLGLSGPSGVPLSLGGSAPFRLAGERDRALNLGMGPPQPLLGLVASWCLAQRRPVTPGW